MKIVVNTRLLIPGKLEGIGWFTYECFRRIVEEHPEHEFHFLFDHRNYQDFLFGQNVHPVVLYPPARRPLLWRIWFERSVARYLEKQEPDLFISTDGFLSLSSPTPSISVIHDLNFEHFPKDMPGRYLKFYKKFFPQYAKKAVRIVTVSNASKGDICKTYNVDSDKVDVVYNGVNDLYNPLPNQTIESTRTKLTQGAPYFLYIGSLHRRKNIDRMLKAYDAYSTGGGDAHLVVVGETMWQRDGIQASSLASKDKIHLVGRKPPEELKNILGSALALVFVSYFEGFGIPILEGFRAGVPVITSNVSSMPEVAGDAALLVDPFSEKAIQDGMRTVSKDADLRSTLITKGFDRVKDFNWDSTAKGLWNSMEKAMNA